MIEVKNLVKKYDNHVALDHLSFTFETGKIYGFLGPNGAGKSTTMNIMTGYIGATEGDVIIEGHSIVDDPIEAKKYIGYLPEIPPLYPEMKVKEYLYFCAQLKKVNKQDIDKEVEESIKTARLSEVQDRLIKNLSKGYKQRVGLAQAILGKPEIIILDEPTVGLDPKQIIEIRDVIKNLGEKHTVILSSHIMQEVSAVCDYIIIISEGKMVASDSPENLSKLFVGKNTLELTIKSKTKNIATILEKIEGVDNIEYSNSDEKECVNVTITSNHDKDVREEVFFAMAKENIPIIQMTLKKISLEDVFLELTSDKENENKGEK